MLRSIIMPAPFVLMHGEDVSTMTLEVKINNALLCLAEEIQEDERVINCQLIETNGLAWGNPQARFYLVVYLEKIR